MSTPSTSRAPTTTQVISSSTSPKGATQQAAVTINSATSLSAHHETSSSTVEFTTNRKTLIHQAIQQYENDDKTREEAIADAQKEGGFKKFMYILTVYLFSKKPEI